LRAGSRVSHFKVGPDELAVLSFPISAPKLPSSITRAEREVVSFLLQGMTNFEIAEQRRTSARTVANQVASIFRKLGVSSRSELVGLLSGSD
jgi:DNA-binding CsgD family transcriptional regulator